MEKIIVTGATGFIGKYVVHTLLQQGYHVIGLGRKPCGLFNPSYTHLICDIRDDNALETVFQEHNDCNTIVHLAADINLSGTSETIETNCIGSYHIARCAAKYGANLLINMSSIPIIGKPLHLPITEAHPATPLTLYHITKLTGECILDHVCLPSMKVMHFRISSPIGIGMDPRNYLSVLLDGFHHKTEVEVYGMGKRIQNYIDVRDIANAVICGIRSPQSGVYLIAGQQSISNRDLALLCKDITGSSASILYGQHDDAEENDRWEISIDKAAEELGFIPQYKIRESISWINDGILAGTGNI